LDSVTVATPIRWSATGDHDLEVVGVVADAPIGNVRDPHVAVAFRPLAHVRVHGDLASVRDAYVRVVESQHHHFVRGLFTFEEWTDNALLRERLLAGVSSAAAGLVLVLACLGIDGMLAHTVLSRTREIGVRAALGATQRRIVGMVVRDGLKVVVPGVLIGMPLALAAANVAKAQFYGVAPTDLWTLGMAASVFVAVGMFAAVVPSSRASRLQPSVALRHD